MRYLFLNSTFKKLDTLRRTLTIDYKKYFIIETTSMLTRTEFSPDIFWHLEYLDLVSTFVKRYLKRTLRMTIKLSIGTSSFNCFIETIQVATLDKPKGIMFQLSKNGLPHDGWYLRAYLNKYIINLPKILLLNFNHTSG